MLVLVGLTALQPLLADRLCAPGHCVSEGCASACCASASNPSIQAHAAAACHAEHLRAPMQAAFNPNPCNQGAVHAALQPFAPETLRIAPGAGSPRFAAPIQLEGLPRVSRPIPVSPALTPRLQSRLQTFRI